MGAHVHSDIGDLPFPAEQIEEVLERILADHERDGAALTVVVVADREIQQLHRDFLGIDEPTDCISFPGDSDRELGEVYLSIDTARRQAEERGLPLEREALLYAVHGTLHLLGYDDHGQSDVSRMREAEARYTGLRGDG